LAICRNRRGEDYLDYLQNLPNSMLHRRDTVGEFQMQLHEALQQNRRREKTKEFKDEYSKRAGVEGAISQGARAFGLRRPRYVGIAKTRLQHLATAAAINLRRVSYWLAGIDRKKRDARHLPA
jgi:hypothetical protein